MSRARHGSARFYKWRRHYSGIDAAMVARLKKLEAENRWLMKVYAEERLKSEIIQGRWQKRGETDSVV